MNREEIVFLREDVPLIRKRTRPGQTRLTLHDDGSLAWFSSPGMEEEGGWLYHGFSTRLGGVSSGETGTMNMTYAREKSAANVTENYRRIAGSIGFEPEKMVFSAQTHTVNVRKVTAQDAGYGFVEERPYHDIDALMTDVPGITLVIFSADCVPLLIADKAHR